MPTEDAYSSGHLVLSHFGTCMCCNVETNLSWACLVSGPLSFEHPSVLLLCPVHSNIIVCQKYIGTSIQVGCATRSLYASSGPCRLWEDLDNARHIVPTAVLVRVQRLKNDLYKAVKGVKHKAYNPLDDYWVILTTSKAFDYFRARRDEVRFAFDLLSL